MDRSLFDAARRRPALLLAAATALFVALMAVQAQADTDAPSTVTLCANPAGQLTVAPASGCPANTTELVVATGDGLIDATNGLEAANEDLDSMLTALEELEERVDLLEDENEQQGADIDELVVSNTQLTNRLGAAEEQIDDLEFTFGGVSRDGTTLLFAGMNLQVVNGTDTTDGDPNGLGNVIIGYNTEREVGSERTGSHYLVVGNDHNYTSFGGIVAGLENTASGDWASVTGGAENTASGRFASVTGGYRNTAGGGDVATVSGGINNLASGQGSSVSGGSTNEASGLDASVSGGVSNRATETQSSVSGGRDNTASGFNSSILGGENNTASGSHASVSGGRWNTASGSYSSILGGGGVDPSDGTDLGVIYGIYPMN